MKEEALKLADELQDYMTSLGWKTHQAPDMIRRLVEELNCAEDYIKQYQLAIKNHKYSPETGEPLIDGYPLFSGLPTLKPLNDEEIEYYEHLIAKLFNCSTTQKVIGLDRVIRAIEERHGIK